jgi:hypothetical protein
MVGMTLPAPPVRRAPGAAHAGAEVASVQRHHIRALAALRDCLVLRDGRAVAVLEVAGRPVVSLAEHDQEDVLAVAFAVFASLQHPVQFLVRAEAADLGDHADAVVERTAADPDLAAVGQAYGAFVRALAGERNLILRRCYATVPADPGLRWTEARQQLAARCDALADGFVRMGMPARRLSTAELVALEASIWNPSAPHLPWDYDQALPAEGQPAGHEARARSALLDGALSVLVPRPRPTIRERAEGLAGHAARLALPARLRERWLGDPPRDPEADAAEAELQAGAEGLADRIAPAAVRALADHVLLKGGADEATRTLKLTAYPRVLSLGWLTPLVTLDATVDLSLHVTPREAVRTLNALGRRLTRLQGSLLTARSSGGIEDPDVLTAVEDLTRLRDGLSRGTEAVFDVACYLHLRAPSVRALGTSREGLQARVEAAVRRLFAETRVAVYQQPDAFRAVLPEATDRVRATRQLDTSSLARTLPFVVATSTGQGILLGFDRRTSAPVLFDAHDPNAPNASIAVVAPAGSGKSYALKLLALRHRFLGAEVLILDPEAEYRRLARAVGGQVVRFAVSGGSHLNPFDLPPAEADDQTGEPSDPVDEQAAALGALFEVMLAAPGSPLTTDQRAALDRAVLAVYRRRGIGQGQPETWGAEAPLLPELHAALLAEGTETAATLAGRLERFVTGPYRGVFGPTDVRLDNPFTVFDVRDVPDDLRPVVTHLVTAFVWRAVRRERRPRLFIADEAATLLERLDSARFVGNFARRCRKYYTGLCIAVQDVTHLQGSREGLDVLANAGTKLILGHGAERVDAAVAAFRLSEPDRQELLAAGKGEGLFVARGDRLSVKVLASPEEHRLVTTRPDEVAAIEAEERAAGAGTAPRGRDGLPGGQTPAGVPA